MQPELFLSTSSQWAKSSDRSLIVSTMSDTTITWTAESVRSRLRAQRAIDEASRTHTGAAALERLRLLKTVDEMDRRAITADEAAAEFDAIARRVGGVAAV